MKAIQYVHDRVVFLWGAESLCADLMHHFWVTDQTRLFTLYSTHEVFAVDGKNIPIVTALPKRINKLFAWWMRTNSTIGRWIFDYRNLMFFYPLLCWLLRRKIQNVSPETLIISSFATAKNVVPAWWRPIPTILYMHSPMQYIWENYAEYMQKLSWWKKWLFCLAARYLRPWDKTKRVYGQVYANSTYTATCAHHYYWLDATVWYPQIPQPFFDTPVPAQVRDYFVYIGRLVRFIREVDRIIELCNTYQLPLLILWTGPDEAYLRSIAWPTIVFVWQVTHQQEKIEVLRHARWLINLAKESCGIATMEALALGVPVLWYAAWWTYELVLQNEPPVTKSETYTMATSGVLVHQKTPDVLSIGMELFVRTTRNRKEIKDAFQDRFRCQSILM